MTTGRHVWKVKVVRSERMLIYAGVAAKPDMTSKNAFNRYLTYSWFALTSEKNITDTLSGACMSRWREEDVLQFELDCDKRVLTVTNLRTVEDDAIRNLPAVELFPYFSLGSKNDTLTLVP